MTTTQALTVGAGYIQIPFQVSFHEVALRVPGQHEVLLDVLMSALPEATRQDPHSPTKR